jgi:hypothetical protein
VNGDQGLQDVPEFRQSVDGLSPQGSGLDLLPDHVEDVVKTVALRQASLRVEQSGFPYHYTSTLHSCIHLCFAGDVKLATDRGAK